MNSNSATSSKVAWNVVEASVQPKVVQVKVLCKILKFFHSNLGQTMSSWSLIRALKHCNAGAGLHVFLPVLLQYVQYVFFQLFGEDHILAIQCMHYINYIELNTYFSAVLL